VASTADVESAAVSATDAASAATDAIPGAEASARVRAEPARRRLS